MNISLVYIHPTANAQTYVPMARRFVESYMANPPGSVDHDIHVAINGSIDIGEWCQRLFNPLPCSFFRHNNYGKDIGAYQAAADFLENGPAMYAPWGFHHPLPHLRTTAFWLPPEFLNSYPVRVGNDQRYAFEHSEESMTLWSQKQGFEPMMVTWRGMYPMHSWHPVTRDESLMVDQHMTPR
jgi:hypothetical protein